MNRHIEILDKQHEVDVSRLSMEKANLEKEIKLERDRMETEKQRMKLDLEKEKTEIERLKADIYQIKTGADVEKIRAQAERNYQEARTIREIDESAFIADVLSKIDPTTLPLEMQGYIVANVFNKKTNSYDDYIMTSKLKEFMEKKAEADTAKTNAEAGKIKSDARYKNFEADSVRNKNSYEEWKQGESKNRWN